MIPLSNISVGQLAQVCKMDVENSANQRLMALGLVPGCDVRVTHIAPLGDPIAIKFGTQSLMVRRVDARAVMVEMKA